MLAETGHHLPHAAQGAQLARAFRVPPGDAHDEARARQALHHVPADEAGAAEDRRHTTHTHASTPFACVPDHMGTAQGTPRDVPAGGSG